MIVKSCKEKTNYLTDMIKDLRKVTKISGKNYGINIVIVENSV